MPRRAAATAAAASQLPPPPPFEQPQPTRWRKVLYAQQPFEDSHTGDSFLEELVVNATVPHRDYATVVWSTLVVDQQLSTVVAAGSASYHLYQGTITARQLLLADVLLMLLGSLLYLASAAWAAAKQTAALTATEAAAKAEGPLAARNHNAGSRHSSPIKQVAAVLRGSPGSSRCPPSPPLSPSKHPPHLANGSSSQLPAWPPSRRGVMDGLSSMAALAMATALLSPLLGTLTETVSSDSVVACACLLQLAHLFLHDYHFSANLTTHLSGSLALGCAVCGSVLVASRMGSPEAVYAQLLLSLEVFILGPYCRRAVAAAGRGPNLVLTLAMVGGAAALLVRQSILLTSSFACSLLFITFICPMWLVRIHKFKALINGPWDEAVPRLSRAVTRHLSQP